MTALVVTGFVCLSFGFALGFFCCALLTKRDGR